MEQMYQQGPLQQRLKHAAMRDVPIMQKQEESVLVIEQISIAALLINFGLRYKERCLR